MFNILLDFFGWSKKKILPYDHPVVTLPVGAETRTEHTFVSSMFALVRFLYENRGGILQAHIHYFHESLLNCMKHMGEVSQPSI